MRPLAKKTALVTGAAAGIGRAIALRLAEKGARLALVDRNPFGLRDTKLRAKRLGADARDFVCDVAEAEQVHAVTEALLDRWAGVDLLVNNTGVAYHGATHAMPADDWDRVIDINLRSHVQFTRELLPSMLARPEAHVLNVCSVLGLSGMPRVAAYCTTKFAMVGFSESLRAEYGRVGLGVTALCPGFVCTGLFDDAPKRPPSVLCIDAERVARRAVRAVERNELRVVIDPVGRFIHGAKRWAPGAFDWLLAMGRRRRVAAKRRELAALADDPTEALLQKLGRRPDAEQRRAA